MTASAFAVEPGGRATTAVFHGPGKPLELVHCRLPAPGGQEALVRVDCCTICGSDLHSFGGARAVPLPTILGHEILGTIAAVGEPAPRDAAGEPVRVGDRVTWSVSASCFECDRCLAGFPQKCRSLFKYGHERCEGGGELSGGLAEALLLRRGSTIVRLPTDLPDHAASPANCATATVAAAFRAGGPVDGRRVLILGAGMLGLTGTAFAHVGGASCVVVCDPDERRLTLASRFGATVACGWHQDSTAFRRAIEREAGQAEFDLVFEFSGSPDAVETACGVAAIGGHVVLVGTVSPTRPVSLDPESIVRRLLNIHGVHNYTPRDLVAAVSFLQRHHAAFPFAELVAASFPLSRINDAFRHAMDHRPIRIAVHPALSREA